MSATASLIPELEEVIQHGSPERRAETLKRITTYFLSGASRFNEDHVRLFDQVFSSLILEIETKARSELSNRLAPIGNAPVEVLRRLAHDDDIAVAGPVLKQSQRLADTDLVDIAQTKSQAHLLAISGRAGIAEPVTDVLVRRGDREVVHSVAENRSARKPSVIACPSVITPRIRGHPIHLCFSESRSSGSLWLINSPFGFLHVMPQACGVRIMTPSSTAWPPTSVSSPPSSAGRSCRLTKNRHSV